MLRKTCQYVCLSTARCVATKPPTFTCLALTRTAWSAEKVISSVQFHTTGYVSKKKGSDNAKKGGKQSNKAKFAAEDDLDFEEADPTTEPSDLTDMEKYDNRMSRVISTLSHDYAEKLVLRTNQSSFNNLKVKVADADEVALQYLGQIHMKGANTIIINLATNPQAVVSVRDALQNSPLNVNPRIDGTTIYVEIPKVSRETRETMAKTAKAMCDKTKEELRRVQNATIKRLKGGKTTFSSDDMRLKEKIILEHTKKCAKKAEEIMKAKQSELLS